MSKPEEVNTQSAYPDVDWEDSTRQVDGGDEYIARENMASAQYAKEEITPESAKRTAEESQRKLEEDLGGSDQEEKFKALMGTGYDQFLQKLKEAYPEFYTPIDYQDLNGKLASMKLGVANKEGAEKARAFFTPDRLAAMHKYSLDSSNPNAEEIGRMADEVEKLQAPFNDEENEGISTEDDPNGADEGADDGEERQSTENSEAEAFLNQKVGDVFKYVYWLDPETKLMDLEISELIYLTSYLKVSAIEWKKGRFSGNLKDAKHDHNVVVQALKYQLPDLSKDLMIFEDIEDTEAGEDEADETGETSENEAKNESATSEDAEKTNNFYKTLFAKISQAENLISAGKKEEAVKSLLEVESMKMSLGLKEDDREILVLGKTALSLNKCNEQAMAIKYLEEAEEKAKESDNSEYLLLFIAACYLQMGLKEKAKELQDEIQNEQSKSLLDNLSTASFNDDIKSQNEDDTENELDQAA